MPSSDGGRWRDVYMFQAGSHTFGPEQPKGQHIHCEMPESVVAEDAPG